MGDTCYPVDLDALTLILMYKKNYKGEDKDLFDSHVQAINKNSIGLAKGCFQSLREL